MGVIMLTGPVGAGKTTIARELIALLPAPLSYMEGDVFWSFIWKPAPGDRREGFHLIMRAMTAAAIPFARMGYSVLIDFSIPPHFLDTARKILKEIPLDYVMVCPSMDVCRGRALNRTEGKIADYGTYEDFYALFAEYGREAICDDESSASSIAQRIHEGLRAGAFRLT